MVVVDVFTSYLTAGCGSLVGLGLMSLVRTDHPRVRQALVLYKLAFLCLSLMVLLPLSPEAWRHPVAMFCIGFAVMGVALLAWAFRQLNGRRTNPRIGAAFTLGTGLLIWGAALWGDAEFFVRALACVFAVVSVGMAVEQGWLIVRSARVTGGERSLLIVAAGFSLIWIINVWYAFTVGGPYPEHWLHAPVWSTSISALAFALLPLSVASVVLGVVNERLAQQLRARALADDLTGTLSRRGLRELGERMLAQSAEDGQRVAVLMLDVDHFKLVNDQHGHLIGDDVLKQIAYTLRDGLRGDALLARYGGEEFTVMMRVRHLREAVVVAERLRELVASRPCKTSVGKMVITVSIGGSFHYPGSSLEETLARADACLYEAKRAGRNRVVFDGHQASAFTEPQAGDSCT